MPRALKKQGLPGLGQNNFPESAREIGRRMGLYEDEAKILQYTEVSDGAGDVNPGWEDPDDVTAVRAHILPIGRVGSEMERGGSIVEGTTHKIFFDAGVDIGPEDRVWCQGRVFIVTARHYQTDELVRSADLKVL
jgi:hypothetical protein